MVGRHGIPILRVSVFCYICCTFTLVFYVFMESETFLSTPKNRETLISIKSADDNVVNKLKISGALNNQFTLVGYPRQICNCSKRELRMPKGEPLSNGSVSFCSKEASEFGKAQKVISFSLFLPDGNSISTVFQSKTDVDLLLQEIRFLFPGWLIRIYSNATLERGNDACNFVCKEDLIFWCDIRNIPGKGDMTKLNPRSWRFLVMDDPSVDIFLSRDLDSQFTLRERVAVAEWEASKLPFHGMRDHPNHSVAMLGGMWGAKNYWLPPGYRKHIAKMLIASAQITQDKGWDQATVIRYIYLPYHTRLVLVHDSYFCGRYPEFKTLPFSIQRNGGEMIGLRNLGNASTVSVCPVKCRPVHGKDWKRC